MRRPFIRAVGKEGLDLSVDEPLITRQKVFTKAALRLLVARHGSAGRPHAGHLSWAYGASHPMKIPRKLGHIWIGPKQQPSQWMQSWIERHPDWEYTLYDNDFLRNGTFRTRAQIDEYMKRGAYAGAADLLRFEILYAQGGYMAGRTAFASTRSMNCSMTVEASTLSTKTNSCAASWLPRSLRLRRAIHSWT